MCTTDNRHDDPDNGHPAMRGKDCKAYDVRLNGVRLGEVGAISELQHGHGAGGKLGLELGKLLPLGGLLGLGHGLLTGDLRGRQRHDSKDAVLLLLCRQLRA